MSVAAILAAAVAALLTGMAKCGIPGLGFLSVPIMAMAMPARESVGALLPILLVGDCVAVTMYRQTARWDWIARLAPWVAVGMAVGAWWLARLDNTALRRVLGTLVLTMVALDALRHRLDLNRLVHHPITTASAGVFAGAATVLGNAAGPVMNIYLLARNLPRQWFVGTAAWFFLLVNLAKVAIFSYQDILSIRNLLLAAAMVPAVLGGAFLGRALLHRLSEGTFQTVVRFLCVLSGLRLLF